MPTLKGKRVLLIIASQNFRDEEFQQPKELLEAQGVKISVASSSLAEATGTLGMKAKADILLNQVKVSDYDGLVFVGGGGAREYYNNAQAHEIAQGTVAQGKILGAICIAPVILANAGLLSGKKAAVFSSEIESIRTKGAIYTGQDVERDGQIITASGPSAATEFGKALITALAAN